MIIDVTPLTDLGYEFLSTALSACALSTVSLAAGFLARMFKVHADNAVQAHAVEVLEEAIIHAVNFAKTKTPKDIDIGGNNVLVSLAVEYLLPKIPKILKTLGITPKGLADRVHARLDTILKITE